MQGIKGCYELYIMVARQLVSPCYFTPAKSVQMAQEDTVQVLTAFHAHDTSVPYKDLSRVCLVFGKHLDLTLPKHQLRSISESTCQDLEPCRGFDPRWP